jgi:hypothetical protein
MWVWGTIMVYGVTYLRFHYWFWARWIFHRYLFTSSLRLSGTLDFPPLPFQLFPSAFGHAGLSTVTFSALPFGFWARWTFHRYLLTSPTRLFDTLDSPPLPFHLFPPAFGHAGVSTVTFSPLPTGFWARWTFHRYLLTSSPRFFGTLDFPPLPFAPLPYDIWARWISCIIYYEL